MRKVWFLFEAYEIPTKAFSTFEAAMIWKMQNDPDNEFHLYWLELEDA